MDRTILYMAVVMVFIFLIFRHRFMPVLASRRMKKEQTDEKALTPAAAYPYPFPAVITAPPGNIPAPERREMYFDYRIIPAAMHTDIPEDSASVAETVSTEISEMLSGLRRRSILPAELSVLRITDEHIMVYTTYIL